MYEIKPKYFLQLQEICVYFWKEISFWKYSAYTNNVKVFESVVLYKNNSVSALSTFCIMLSVKFKTVK